MKQVWKMYGEFTDELFSQIIYSNLRMERNLARVRSLREQVRITEAAGYGFEKINTMDRLNFMEAYIRASDA